jgi:hypothetical protein
MTFGMHPRTVNFPTPDIRKMYGEDLSAELYQRMQAGHQTSRTLAGEFMKTAGEKSKMDHEKKHSQGHSKLVTCRRRRLRQFFFSTRQ